MVELHRYAEMMPRSHRYTVGERIKNESISLAVNTYRIGQNKDVLQNKAKSVENIEIIRLLLRLLMDLKQISQSYFTMLNQRMEYLYLSLL